MAIDFKQREANALDELHSLVNRIRKFEAPFRKILLRKYPSERTLEAEGKKCILSVTGLRYHQEVIFFEVSELSIKSIEPFESFDTWIEIDLPTLLTVLKNVLSGREDVLGDAFGSNSVKVRGSKTYHDMSVFSEIAGELSRAVRRFRATGG